MALKIFDDQVRMVMTISEVPDPPEPPPPGYILREFRPGDEPGFAALMRDAGFEGWTEATVREKSLSGLLGSKGVWFIEHDGKIVGTCTAYVRRDESGLVNKPAWMAVHPDHRKEDLAEYERLLRGEVDTYVRDTKLIRRDRTEIDITVNAQCVRDSDGKAELTIATVQDDLRRGSLLAVEPRGLGPLRRRTTVVWREGRRVTLGMRSFLRIVGTGKGRG